MFKELCNNWSGQCWNMHLTCIKDKKGQKGKNLYAKLAPKTTPPGRPGHKVILCKLTVLKSVGHLAVAWLH